MKPNSRRLERTAKALRLAGVGEAEVLDFDLGRLRPGAVVVDIGANSGGEESLNEGGCSMEIRRKVIDQPFFSVCIPQYNRTPFLIESCRGLAEQTFRNFEVCISDDRSTDGKEQELLEFLEHSGLSFVYRKQERNVRYDANLRASIDISSGEYCLLLGNDDTLASPTSLYEIYEEVQASGPIGVAITNFEDFATGRRTRRIRQGGVLGAGPIAAANNFRNVSFVSGVILNGDRARALATAKWDGSEMYQMYLTCRILAEGGRLLGIDRVAVRKDIQIPGEQIDSYATRPRLNPCPIIERKLTLHLIGRLVVDAIAPYLHPETKQATSERVLRQLLMFPYPYWIFEYRRVQSWNYAVGVCLGMRPGNLTEGIKLGLACKSRIVFVYLLVSLVGLTLPVQVFEKLYSWLHLFAKSKWGQLVAGVKGA